MKVSLTTSGLILVVLVLAGCEKVSLDFPKESSFALEDTSATGYSRKVSEWLGGNADANGFYPLTESFDAFGARLALMASAEASIDAQYFLMKPDNAGLVFSAKMLEAAQRGVRVRLLLDDIYTSVSDSDLAVLNQHPNIEVRIFNPIAREGNHTLNFLGNFKLANRRMHNKAFVVDNQVAVVGGRNIASEYFQLETATEFIDFDMLSVGPIVKAVSAQFDTYWNHRLALPLEALYKPMSANKLEQSRARMKQKMVASGDTIYADALHTPVIEQFFAKTTQLYVADAQLLSDQPEKLLVVASDEQQIVVNAMLDAMAAAESEIIIITPYFIPRQYGIEFIKDLRAKGIRITLLTNSLATNNHTSVHSSYAGYRKDLLKAGVELWEARSDAAKIITEDGETQLEHLTLHTKGIVIDRKRVFGGSLNLDPRSTDINTEMGLLIDSAELGAHLSDLSYAHISNMAYRLKLDDDNNITWHANIDGKDVVETKEPQTSLWQRVSAWFLKIAPERQL
jgi:putative cardiolipin synthase